MNRRDVFRLMGAGGLAAIGVRSERTSAEAMVLPIELELFDDGGAWESSLTRAAPWPLMNTNEVYCLHCDAWRLWPERIGRDHVATRFINDHERLHTNIYLSGEQVLNAYEALDGRWAIRTWGDRPQSHQLFGEGCTYRNDDGDTAPILVEFVMDAFEVRRSEGFDPLLAGMVGDNAQW